MLFSVKPAVCCCVYLNSRELIPPARSLIANNWLNWFKDSPGVDIHVGLLHILS